MRLLVIGGSGLVGANLTETAREAGHDVWGTSREGSEGLIKLDKTDAQVTREVLSEVNPDAIVDTAAFHAVDDCETDRERAWAVNAGGTRNVGTAANECDAHFIYLSTDYVFPGNPDEAPYEEEDPVGPINYYARSKLAGEQAALIADCATILRPSVIYGLSSGNFATWALSEVEAGNEINVVDDQVSNPTFAPDLAHASIEILENDLTGTYHSTGPESMSRYEFTRLLAAAFNYDPELVSPISTEDLGQTAKRPQDSSLDSSQLYHQIQTEFSNPKTAFEEMKKDS